MINTGFGQNMKFIRNIFGIDVYMSNRLPRVADETINTAGAGMVAAPQGETGVQTAGKQIQNGIACQFMIVSDDQTTPYMSAWRRMPKVEYERDAAFRRDKFFVTSRYGNGMQRPQSLITVLASGQNY